MTEQLTDQAAALDLDSEVRRYLELTELIEQLSAERASIVEALRELGAGQHSTTYGVSVSVAAPSRTFDVDAAWAVLTPEQRALCVKPDPAKVKGQLPGVLVESFMREGAGTARVTIK